MALLERVATLIRANLNDLVDKAEDPEKLLKQVILDMENQLMQVKTQVAVSIADLHLLEAQRREHVEKAAEWRRKASIAVARQDDALARAAVERSLHAERIAGRYEQQIADQQAQVDNLKSAFGRLERKLLETRQRCELLMIQHRRARALGKAAGARPKSSGSAPDAAVARMQGKVRQAEAISRAHHELLAESSLEDRLMEIEREGEIERVLQEIKGQRRLPA